MGLGIEVLKFFGYQPSEIQKEASKVTSEASKAASQVEDLFNRSAPHQEQVASFGKYSSSSFTVHSILARSGTQLCEKAEGTLERCTEYYDLDNPSMNGRFQSFLGEAYHSEFPS